MCDIAGHIEGLEFKGLGSPFDENFIFKINDAGLHWGLIIDVHLEGLSFRSFGAP